MAFGLEPDLHPLYPSPTYISSLLTSCSGLSPSQKSVLVTHCLTRACVFADLPLLQHILHDHSAQPYVDLNIQDEDGLVLASVTILGFGSESDRDVEREECVRLLITEGADANVSDRAGWAPLHYAALLAPPTLISYLLTHGCSPLSVTRRKLTALDIVTAYSVIPGREDVALFLEEAMLSEGWTSNRVVKRRQSLDRKLQRQGKEKCVRQGIAEMLHLNEHWWGDEEELLSDETDPPLEIQEVEEELLTPPLDYSSMLVFSPASLPAIFESLITNFAPSTRNAEPANALHMLARFACVACDQNWLEELIIGATDAIEEKFFNQPEDLALLTFWLYNTTTWLHLLRCDSAINEPCEALGSFVLIEEVINSVFVFIIRYAERRIDKLLDTTLLDHSPIGSDFDGIQFESEWSFFRSPFSAKKKLVSSTALSPAASMKSTAPPSPRSSSRPPSPSPIQSSFATATPKSLSTLRQTITRARASSAATPLQSLFADPAPPSNGPNEITTFLTALHTLMADSGINPAITAQLWSQVMYWTSCEIFNRILTRKRHLCRSRAIQVGINLSVLEEWVGSMGLPRGVESHFAPVRELLQWLQCLSSMDEFSGLVSTIQTMKHLNPLQMRRAVRDYRYEVNETRMSEDCGQYLAQLQKDWERQRIKLGVEALRREIDERDRDGSISSQTNGSSAESSPSQSITTSSIGSQLTPMSIDILFDRKRDKSEWVPVPPPEVLGELLDSRYMLPLLLPSDPRLLAASPAALIPVEKIKRHSGSSLTTTLKRNSSISSPRGPMEWKLRSRELRDVSLDILHRVDGANAIGRYGRPPPDDFDEEQLEKGLGPPSDDDDMESPLTPLTRNPSGRGRSNRPNFNLELSPDT